MRPLRRAGVLGVATLCAAGSVLIIGYYGTPLVRTALAGSIGFLIASGMTAGLRAAHHGELVRDHRRPDSHPDSGTARVYYLPLALIAGNDDAGEEDAEAKKPRRVPSGPTRR